MTPMLGLQVMLTESSVTPIDQNTHSVYRYCLVRRMLYIYYFSIYWSDTSLGTLITSYKHAIITLKLHRSDQSRYLCRLPPAKFNSKNWRCSSSRTVLEHLELFLTR